METSKRSVLSLTLAMPGWFYALFLAIGLGVAIPAEVMFEQALRLQMGGEEVTGQVAKLWQGSQKCVHNDMDSCTTYNVAYGFEAGTMRQTQTSVSADFYGTLHEGGPIQVRYVLADPTINEVEFGWTLFGGVLLFVFASVFLLTGGIGLRGRLHRARQIVLLRDTGVERSAQVTGLEPTRTRINGRTLYRMLWRDETGALGKSDVRRAEKLPAVGTSITVYTDRAGTLPAVWQGDAGSR